MALITGGSITVSDLNGYIDLLDDRLLDDAIFLIIVGCVIIVVTFLGCDFCKKYKCLMIVYTAFLIVIFLAELAAGITAITYKDDINNTTVTKLSETIKSYDPSQADSSITKHWDNMQQSLECCGAYSANDWDLILQLGNRPPSCCVDKNCGGTPAIKTNVFNTSCISALEDELHTTVKLLSGLSFGSCVIMVFGIVISFFIAIPCCC